jgi:cytochrome P450
MLPVVSVMGRVAGSDMHCGPYKIPKGIVVGTPLFAIQNTVHNWESPHEYRPERWLDVPVEAWVYDSTTNTTGGESHGWHTRQPLLLFTKLSENLLTDLAALHKAVLDSMC